MKATSLTVLPVVLPFALFLGVRDLEAKPQAEPKMAVEPLERVVSLTAKNRPIREALVEACRAANAELDLDADGLKSSGLDLDRKIPIEVKDVTLREALRRIIWSIPVRERGGALWLISRFGPKVFVGELRTLEDKVAAKLPEWLRGRAELDAEFQIVSCHCDSDALLAQLKKLPRLRELSLQPSKALTAAGLAQLAEFPALEKLEIFECTFGDQFVASACRVKTLRELSVTHSGVTDAGLRALESRKELTSLSLASNRLTDAAMESLAGLTKLRSLNLSASRAANIAMQITDEGLKKLAALENLEELFVSGLDIAGQWWINFPKLRGISLSGDKVNDETMISIARCARLTSLALSYTSVTDVGMSQLAALRELQHLDLDSHVVTDAGIAHLKQLPKLQHVQLRASRLSDASLAHLAEIKTLTRVDLHGSGEPGVNWGRLFTGRAVAGLKSLPRLEHLWMTNWQADDYAALGQLKQIRILTLFVVGIPEAQVAQLEEALPYTVISARNGNKVRARVKK